MIGSWFAANRPSVLVGIGIVGIGTLGVVSFRSGLRCAPIIEKYRNQNMTSKERAGAVLKEAWPELLPPILIGIADCGLFLGAHNELVKRASIATALAATYETANSDLRKQIRKELGDTAAQRIEDKVVEEEVSRKPPSKSVQVTGHGDRKSVV